jgi:hypothetical protein
MSKAKRKKLLRKCWRNLLIAFSDNYTRDGFKMTQKAQKKFDIPQNILQFEFRLKREMTICNLFANHYLSTQSIARVLDMDYGKVVSTLIDHGFIKERRRNAKKTKCEEKLPDPQPKGTQRGRRKVQMPGQWLYPKADAPGHFQRAKSRRSSPDERVITLGLTDKALSS